MRLGLGLGTGSCQGHLVVPCPSKAASGQSCTGVEVLACSGHGLALVPAFALLFSRSVILPVYFILSFFGSSTIDKAQRERRVFFVLDRIIFCFVFEFPENHPFSVKNPTL